MGQTHKAAQSRSGRPEVCYGSGSPCTTLPNTAVGSTRPTWRSVSTPAAAGTGGESLHWFNYNRKLRHGTNMSIPSNCLEALRTKLRAGALNRFDARRLNIVESVGHFELFPFESAHLVKRQDIDSFHVS
jgi:hypothetical protein